MRVRAAIGFAVLAGGIILLAASVVTWVFLRDFPFSISVSLVLGVVLVILGLIVLTTEFLEAALSRGQTALVDGLQAG